MGSLIEKFLIVFNMSLTASVVMLIVLILRRVFQRMPKSIFYGMWAVVLFRFACPTSFASALSIFNLIKVGNTPINDFVISFSQANIRNLTAMKNSASQPVSALAQLWPNVFDNLPVGFWVYKFAALIWVTGVVIILVLSFIAYLRLKNKLADATKLQDNIYETDIISSPFVFGIIRPKIILPLGIAHEDVLYIVRHERVHIRRYDHIVKLLSFVILSLHWFNPCAWLTFQLMNKDLEMSCDEMVLKDQNQAERIGYSESLLRVSLHRRLMIGNKLAFGENGIKARIKNILESKLPVKGVMILFAAFIIVAGLSLITNPKPLITNPSFEEFKGDESIFGKSLYATISHEASADEINAVQPVLNAAENVFKYTGDIDLADGSVGALKRYYYSYDGSENITSVDLDLNLVTAKLNRSDGTVWVIYSVIRYSESGEIVNGSVDILSCWQIKNNDGDWVVVDIIEHA